MARGEKLNLDRIVLRGASMAFAVIAIAGWISADAYKTPIEESFELIILAALALSTAAIPASARGLALSIGITLSVVASFGWWIVAIGPMEQGGYDMPGFVFRLLGYACVVSLALPWKARC